MEEEWEWKVEEVGVRGEGGGGECERDKGFFPNGTKFEKPCKLKLP